MTPEEIRQVVEDYKKSSKTINEQSLINFDALRNLRVNEKDKYKPNGAQGAQGGENKIDKNKNKNNDNVGAQGGQGPQNEIDKNKNKNNDNVGAQGGTTGSQGAQGGTTGSQGAQGPQNEIDKNKNKNNDNVGAQGGQGPQSSENTVKDNSGLDLKGMQKYSNPNRKEITMKDFASPPPKPTNPSGKVIPKPKKPLMKNSPAAKAGIPIETRQKFANQNAAFQATKNKDSGYNKMDFIKDFPNSQTAKKFNKGEPIPGFSYKKNLKNSYEPYDLLLDYVLSEGHADTVEEAHYVMTQMDEETIKEFIGKAALIGTGAYLGYKGLKKAGDSFNQFLNNQRNNSKIGGNKRVDDVRKNSNDPNVGQKINFGAQGNKP